MPGCDYNQINRLWCPRLRSAGVNAISRSLIDWSQFMDSTGFLQLKTLGSAVQRTDLNHRLPLTTSRARSIRFCRPCKWSARKSNSCWKTCGSFAFTCSGQIVISGTYVSSSAQHQIVLFILDDSALILPPVRSHMPHLAFTTAGLASAPATSCMPP